MYKILFCCLVFTVLTDSANSQKILLHQNFDSPDNTKMPDSTIILNSIKGFYRVMNKDTYDASRPSLMKVHNLYHLGNHYYISIRMNYEKNIPGFTSNDELFVLELFDTLTRDKEYDIKVNISVGAAGYNAQVPTPDLSTIFDFGFSRLDLGKYLTPYGKGYFYEGINDKYFSYTKNYFSAKIPRLSDSTKIGFIPATATYKAKGKEKYLLLSVRNGKVFFMSFSIDDIMVVERGFDFNLNSMSPGDKLTIPNILFGFNSAILQETSYSNLNKLVDILKQNANLRIEISGHTDNTGTEAANQKLSESRAKSIVDYLITKGIDKTRLTYKGYGSTQPLVPNTSDAGKAQNRRVELKMLEK